MARLGVALGGGMSPVDIVDCVKLAEELGYESAWVVEGHGGDQFSILTACAVQTQRILLGTSISSIFVRSVPTIAMAAACGWLLVRKRTGPALAVAVLAGLIFWWHATATKVANEWIAITPYVVTLAVLAMAAQRLRPPAADGRRYRKGQVETL